MSKKKMEISKREVTTLVKKIAKGLMPLKTLQESEDYIRSIIPDFVEIHGEYIHDYEDLKEEFKIDVIIPRKYTGKHSVKEYEEAIEYFDSFIENKSLTIYIDKTRNKIDVEVYSYFDCRNTWGEIESADLLIKKEEVYIPLEYRKEDIDELLSDIKKLSNDMISRLLHDENIGNAIHDSKLIDIVRKEYFKYIKEYIESTLKVPYDWQDAWNIFRKNVSINDIVNSLDFKEEDLLPNYNVIKNCRDKIEDIKSYFNDVLNAELEISNLSKDDLIKLTYVEALSAYINHCKNNNKESMKKMKDLTIPKVLAGSYEDDFYLKRAKSGLERLRNL